MNPAISPTESNIEPAQNLKAAIPNEAPARLHTPVWEHLPDDLAVFISNLAELFGCENLAQIDWVTDGRVKVAKYQADQLPGETLVVETDGDKVLPLADDEVGAVFNLGSLGELKEHAVAGCLRELYRVTTRGVWITLSRSSQHDLGWWENRFFEAGFRKHPRSMEVLPYESLEQNVHGVLLFLEKIPAAGLSQFPLSALKAERELHMDMTRETGRRSDAHIARYAMACQYLPKDGLVLDAACGLGYGSAILAAANPAVRVVGIDNSEYAVRYARACIMTSHANTDFRLGDACDLSDYPDASVGLVVSFETVEHLREPRQFLAEVRRVLKPGGVFVCSVPNMWVDESGKDPNPWHYHVFDYARLATLCGEFLELTHAYRQTAGGGMKLNHAPRQLERVNFPVPTDTVEAEWWLMAATRSGLADRHEGNAVTTSSRVIVLTHDPKHPLYSSWIEQTGMEVEFVTDAAAGYKFPSDTGLVVSADCYSQPRVTLLRRAVEEGIPTLLLADGILEYRNTWDHPQISPGSLFQPVMAHKIACLGRSQVRTLQSWGNDCSCEVVGSPRFDRYAAISRRSRSANQTFRVLVMTAMTPYFSSEQKVLVHRSLADLERYFEDTKRIGDVVIEPVWRLTKGLDREIGVESSITDLTGRELMDVLQNVDAVVSTPSTSMLEAMLVGLPVATLDYTNSPLYVQPAWRISAPEHILSVVPELVVPPAARMLFQDATLHDALECSTLAAPRMVKLARKMIEAGREARQRGKPLSLSAHILSESASCRVERETRFQPEMLYPECRVFRERDLLALQVEIEHLRRALNGTARVSPTSGGVASLDTGGYSFLETFVHARRGKGREDQAALWDVTLDGRHDRGIYMQPPVDLTFRIPTGEHGRFVSAVCVHPLAWDKPGAGGCEFHLRIDGRVVHVVALDPVHLPADRHWHELNVAVPERADGFHEVSLEVRSIGGSNAYRWGIWRAPKFSFVTIPASSPPPVSIR